MKVLSIIMYSIVSCLYLYTVIQFINFIKTFKMRNLKAFWFPEEYDNEH